jgi:alkaline phosphatase D
MLSFLLMLTLAACKHEPQYPFCPFPYKTTETISRLDYLFFGSCAREKKPVPIFYKIAEKRPQLFLFLGDNVYGDTQDMKVLQSRYNQMSCKSEFQTLAETCPMIATWDDHDFGQNDAGLEYPYKAESKEVFLKFWGEAANSTRWQHEGIYTSYFFGDTAHLAQIILLDLRTFRTALKTDKNDNYLPNFDADATILGQAQWAWLKTELQKPAKVRIIASSSQFASPPVGFEGWANFPLEKQKMADLIAETKANGVIFLSGDLHYGELSKWETTNTYPLYDLTSSGLNQINDDVADNNTNRVGEALQDYNFGAVRLNWDTLPSAMIHFQLFDGNGAKRYEKIVSISELGF